jgi:uncharacterized protein YegP (UPF0339 family)
MPLDKWTLYKDKAGEWRWRRQSPNGEIVAASSEGYKNYADMLDNAIICGYPDLAGPEEDHTDHDEGPHNEFRP